jgi:hypothetical protein
MNENCNEHINIATQLSPPLALQSMWYVLFLFLLDGMSGFVYVIGNESYLVSE